MSGLQTILSRLGHGQDPVDTMPSLNLSGATPSSKKPHTPRTATATTSTHTNTPRRNVAQTPLPDSGEEQIGSLADDNFGAVNVSVLDGQEDSDDEDSEIPDDEEEDVDEEPIVPPAPTAPKPGTKLFHMVIYLAPGDYHRIHAPAAFNIRNLRHFPGTLFPISPLVARLIPNLFSLNERVVLSGSGPFGFFSMTAVGAYNVGSMSFNFDKSVITNRLRRDFRNPNLRMFTFGGCGCYAYNSTYPGDGIRLAKGQELGRFNLGSTVVLIFEAPADFTFSVLPGDKVGHIALHTSNTAVDPSQCISHRISGVGGRWS
jgi:phosphatidylserine decarboxylase precursor